MGTNPTDATATAWARLVRAQAKALAGIEAALKAEDYPPLAWYDVLLELGREESGALRPLELETRLLVAQHNVSRLIDRMERAGLVSRKPYEGDGRGQLVEITDLGRDLRKRMWPTYRAAIQQHVGDKLSGSEAERLAALLGKLLQ